MSRRKINRREFLAATGATLSAPLVMTGCAAPGRVAANEQVTLGIIGTGIRARNLMQGYLLQDPRLRILALCDVDTTRREHYKAVVDKHYGNQDCSTCGAHEELLARDDLDAVVIATPDHWHATQAIAAAEAGKDVYCEKPLTHTLREGPLLAETVRRTGCVFQTGSQQRSEYGYRFVRAVEYVRSGRLGRLLTVHVGVGDPPRACDLPAEPLEPGLDWDRWLGPAPERPYHSDLSPRGVHGHYPRWRAYWEYSGGYLADMGAHHFDIAQWALEADAAGPVAVLPPDDPEALRGATLLYPNGVRVVHGGPSGVTFLGTEGMLHVDRGRLVAVPGDILETPLAEDEIHLPRNASHVDDWVRAIHARGTPICSAEIGARSAAVCQLLNLAYRLRRPIEWDPVAWRFQDQELEGWQDYDRRAAWRLPGA